MMMVRYYQTLNDILNSIVQPRDFNGLDLVVKYGYAGDGINPNDSLSVHDMMIDNDVVAVWSRIVIAYQNEYVMLTNDEELSADDKTKFVLRLVEWLSSTYGYYKTLTVAHTDLDPKLTKGVITTDKHGFADLPQQDSFSLDPTTADNKITALDLVERDDQRETAMKRIREIEREYHDVLNEWVHSWSREFIIQVTDGLEESNI